MILGKTRFIRNTAYLRVNEEWEASCLGDNDTILGGQLIIWQALKVPLTNGGRVCQHVKKV